MKKIFYTSCEEMLQESNQTINKRIDFANTPIEVKENYWREYIDRCVMRINIPNIDFLIEQMEIGLSPKEIKFRKILFYQLYEAGEYIMTEGEYIMTREVYSKLEKETIKIFDTHLLDLQDCSRMLVDFLQKRDYRIIADLMINSITINKFGYVGKHFKNLINTLFQNKFKTNGLLLIYNDIRTSFKVYEMIITQQERNQYSTSLGEIQRNKERIYMRLEE